MGQLDKHLVDIYQRIQEIDELDAFFYAYDLRKLFCSRTMKILMIFQHNKKKLWSVTIHKVST